MLTPKEQEIQDRLKKQAETNCLWCGELYIDCDCLNNAED
jgi:hypothetical protein